MEESREFKRSHQYVSRLLYLRQNWMIVSTEPERLPWWRSESIAKFEAEARLTEQVAGFSFNSASFINIEGSQHLNFTRSLQPNDILDPQNHMSRRLLYLKSRVTVIDEEDTKWSLSMKPSYHYQTLAFVRWDWEKTYLDRSQNTVFRTIFRGIRLRFIMASGGDHHIIPTFSITAAIVYTSPDTSPRAYDPYESWCVNLEQCHS